jgi:hypothetical protein
MKTNPIPEGCHSITPYLTVAEIQERATAFFKQKAKV